MDDACLWEELSSPEGRYFQRVLAVAMVRRGMRVADVAAAVGKSVRTVEGWLQRYRRGGCEALRDRPRSGRPSRLTEKQRADLRRLVQVPPSVAGYPDDSWHGKLLLRVIKERYGVELQLRQCQRLLRAMAPRAYQSTNAHQSTYAHQPTRAPQGTRAYLLEGMSGRVKEMDGQGAIWSAAVLQGMGFGASFGGVSGQREAGRQKMLPEAEAWAELRRRYDLLRSLLYRKDLRRLGKHLETLMPGGNVGKRAGKGYSEVPGRETPGKDAGRG